MAELWSDREAEIENRLLDIPMCAWCDKRATGRAFHNPDDYAYPSCGEHGLHWSAEAAWQFTLEDIAALLAEVRRQAEEIERLRAGKSEQVERADKWLDRTQNSITYFTEALDILAHIVSQANVNQVGEGEWVERYDIPVGSIHKAIPFLQRHGIVVDVYGAIHRSPSIWPEGETK